MDSTSMFYWACSAVAWFAFFYRLPDLWRRPRSPMRTVVCVALGLTAGIMTFAAPEAIAFVNRTTGIPNLAALLVYCLIVAASASGQILVVYWRDSSEHAWRTVRRWVIGYSAVIVVMITLFAIGEAPVERRVDFDTYYAHTPYIAEFIVLYLVAHAVAIVTLGWTCRRWAAVAGRPWLRRGLRVIAAGSLPVLAYDVCKLVAFGARHLDYNVDILSSLVAPAAGNLGTMTMAVGFVLPLLGDQIGRLRSRIVAYKSCRQLAPLWTAMREALPEIVPPVRLPWWDYELRLTRCLTEIRDARLALRPYMDPLVAPLATERGTAAGLTGSALHAAVEATRLKAAIEAKATSTRYPTAPSQDEPVLTGDGVSELAWLMEVADAFGRSPIDPDIRSAGLERHAGRNTTAAR